MGRELLAIKRPNRFWRLVLGFILIKRPQRPLTGGGPIGNSFAYFALFAWPAVCVVLFVMLPVEAAAIWSLLGGYLLLPSATSVDVALLPPLDKFSIPAISTFLLCWMKGTQSPPPARSPLIYCLAFAFVVSPIFTSVNNSYELQIGNRSIAGFYPLDGVKLALRNLFTLAPFFVGMRFLSSDNGRALLLKSLPTAALFYSVPMLFEIRMAPVLQSRIYGSFPEGLFIQQVRNGGFRPVVFLNHGLEVALFTAIALIAAIIAARARWRILRIGAGAVAAYLAVLLFLCKSLASAVYAAVLAPVVLLTGPRTWVRVSCAVVLLVCAYPMLRTYNIVPVHHIVDAAKAISAERSSSFQTRVENEDMLLAKGNEKPIFGWGTWGRSLVYDQSGTDVSITDGEWILQFGKFGWVGYLSLFGLFAAAAMRARKAVRGPVTEATIVLGGTSLLLAVNMADLLPNAALLPFTYVIAGSLAGSVRARSTRQWPQRRLGQAPTAVIAAHG